MGCIGCSRGGTIEKQMELVDFTFISTRLIRQKNLSNERSNSFYGSRHEEDPGRRIPRVQQLRMNPLSDGPNL